MEVYPSDIQRMIDALTQDKFFQEDIETPLVREAVEHWLGINRLSPEEADEKFNDNCRVLQAFHKIRSLQEACKKENVPFPLHLILKDQPSQPKSVLKQRSTRGLAKEASVRFAEPAKEVEVTYKVNQDDDEYSYGVLNSHWFSLEPSNVATWWSLQFFMIGVLLTMYIL